MHSLHKILYLGIDAPCGVFHYPVIRTKKIESAEVNQALLLWSQCTHVIFTSKNGVRYWPRDLTGKVVVAIGEGTAKDIQMHNSCPLIAPEATQEGVISLLNTLDLSGAFILYPRSKLARPILGEYLNLKKIHHYTFDLYEIEFQKPEPIPDLSDFDEIVFTSPSTVQAFAQIFPSIPRRIALTPIGPITKKALVEYFSPRI